MLNLERPEHSQEMEFRSASNRLREVEAKRMKQSEWIDANLTVSGKAINLHFRPWWSLPYDLDYIKFSDGRYRRKSIVIAGRQIEKCVFVDSGILLPNGLRKVAGAVGLGEVVVGLGENNTTLISGEVTWKSEIVTKRCLRLRTRQGHEAIVARTHPFRVWDGWKVAEDISIREQVGVVRHAGLFGQLGVDKSRIVLTAFLIGDGCLSGSFSFTTSSDVLFREFEFHTKSIGGSFRCYMKGNTRQLQVARMNSKLKGWLVEDGLYGKKSAYKFIPDWVFYLSEEDTSLFINRLWATDGHVKRNSKSQWSIEYSSVSKRLIGDVQALLWKFGIPSRIRVNVPTLYKGTDKVAYILRVETYSGVTKFLERIGALGKSENVSIAHHPNENNNRDTFPIEIERNIQAIYSKRQFKSTSSSLDSVSLRRTLKYPPSQSKLSTYIDFFSSQPDIYDQEGVDYLRSHLNSDLYWDRVVEIEDAGVLPCVDFSVGNTSSFIVDGFVTHNSSSLANKALAEAQIPWTNILYVAPSNTQLSEFSFRRIDEVISTSPRVAHQRDDEHWSVSRKAFTNHSSITLRAAYLTPDRVRGIPAEVLFIDEAQDVIQENIPVIQETMAHCDRVEGPIYRLLGTPKTYDNALEYYWSQESTQNEWMIKCNHCGKWNEGVFEDNIGPKGLFCIKCKAALNPFGDVRNGRRYGAGWFRTGPENADMEGFRIPQLLLPYSFSYSKELFARKWEEILYKYRRYPRPKFYNEVLGISYDSGDKPVTREDLKACCMVGEKFPNLDAPGSKAPPALINGFVFAGVDWGMGDPSKTLFSAARYCDDIFEVFYLKEFTKALLDPEFAVPEVLRLLEAVNANYVGLDWGLGFGLNSKVRKEFGYAKTFVYCHTNQRDKISYDGSALVYIVNRTAVLADIFQLLKGRQIRFRCSWEELLDGGFAGDFLSVHKELNAFENLKYDHPKGTTDDTLHSVTFSFLASQAKYARPDLQ